MKGVYALIISVKKDLNLRIGSIGNKTFNKGDYVYVGSAQNNLVKRVERHLSNEKNIHWHIDYLLTNDFVNVDKVFYNKKDRSEECLIAQGLMSDNECINDFGSSDCNCKSHLFKISDESIIGEMGLSLL